MADRDQVERVKAKHEMMLMAIPGVEGVAIGDSHGKPEISVFVSDPALIRSGRIPAALDDVPVRVSVTGQFHAQ